MSLWLPDDNVLVNNSHLLKETLSRYRRLLDGDGYAFWEWGLHNGTYRCGGSFWEKLGYEAVDDSVTSVDNVQEYVHPDDFGFVYNVILDHLRHNAPINVVYRIKAADGTYWWTQASASSTRDSNGRVTFLTGVNFDLSHLKDTEKALRLSEARHERVLSDSNDGIWEWSAMDANVNPRKAGRIGRLHTSYSFWRQLGYSEEEMDSLPGNERLAIWKSHIHPHDLPRLNHCLKMHFKTRGPIDFEYRVFGEKGKMFWLRSRGNSIFNTHGRMILMSGININITEFKESEERVRKAKEDAERANKSKTNFLSSISHELRTPLNAILGFSRLLAGDEALEKNQRENAHYIHDAGNYLLQLVNGILDLAQIEAGKLFLSMERIFPAAIVRESFTYCRNGAAERQIALLFEPNGLEYCSIYVDPMRLRQCLLNLINNAIKYNVDGGTVRVCFSEVNGDLAIAVIDTGMGISLEQQKNLFEMFNRLGAERSNVEGSGVGLVLTRQLAKAMKGNLLYSDALGKGACFTLYFSLLESCDGEEAAVNNNLVPYSASQTVGLSFSITKKLFYIEDNRSNIRLLEAWLQPYSQLTLLSEMDPILGLYQIRSELPDIVLIDINLPGISGYDLLCVLKQDPLTQHLPVVALSASAMALDIERGRSMGFDDYLTKPLNLDQLFAVINRLLGRQAA
jgi:PAS domain S-box-containing protein